MHKGKLLIFLSLILSISLLLSFQLFKASPSASDKCENSDEIFQCLNSYMEEYAINEGIPLAISELDRIKEVQKFSFFCHTLAHSLGVYGYEKYSSIPKALDAGGKSCSDGYYHGVVEEGARATPLEEYANSIDSYCDAIKDELLNLDCVHGLGHGAFISSQGDTRLGSDICAGLASSFDRLMCLSGLFMQYSLDLRTTWKISSLPEITAICNEQFVTITKEYKDACLMNIFLQVAINDFKPTDFSMMREICSIYTGENLKSCYYGIGYAGPGLVNFDPNIIAGQICGNQTDFASAKCVHRESQAFGAVLGKKAMIEELCPLFIKDQQVFCFEVKDYELR